MLLLLVSNQGEPYKDTMVIILALPSKERCARLLREREEPSAIDLCLKMLSVAETMLVYTHTATNAKKSPPIQESGKNGLYHS